MSVNQRDETKEADEMTDTSLAQFERELVIALRPADPPEGFAQRTQARAALGAPGGARLLQVVPRTRLWALPALAALLLVGAWAGERVHLRRQREQAALAERKFEVAVGITDRTLEHTREQLRRAGVQLGE
jgi:hypothetical protein